PMSTLLRSRRSLCRDPCSRSSDLGVHDGPIFAFTMGRNPQPRHDRRGTPLRDWRAEGLSRAAGEGSGDPPTWAHVGWSSARATSTSGATRFFGTGCRFERLLQLLAPPRVRDVGE